MPRATSSFTALPATSIIRWRPEGSFDPDQVHLPGVYVKRLLINPHPDKRIEFRTTRRREDAAAGATQSEA